MQHDFFLLKSRNLIKKFSFSLITLLVIFIGCLWCLLSVGDMVFEDKSQVFDEHVFSLIHPYINTDATKLAYGISFFGSSAFLLPAYIMLITFLLFVKKL